jgi:hypothetical protein
VFDISSTPTCKMISKLDLGRHIVSDSAVYNTAEDMYLAILTHVQGESSYITLAAVQDPEFVIDAKSTTTLSSTAYKVQWFVGPDQTPYIITDEYGRMSLYAVDLNTYTLTLTASTANMAAGYPSTYLYWLWQDSGLYVIQGYGQTQAATYKVNFNARTIGAGVVSDMSTTFSTVNGCSTCYDYLVLAGVSKSEEGTVARYSVDSSGYLTGPSITASVGSSSSVYYCERCCCNDNDLLVGTDAGLYSLDSNTLDIAASNTSMSSSKFINVCWCCTSEPQYCIAVNSSYGAYIFEQVDSQLVEVLPIV